MRYYWWLYFFLNGKCESNIGNCWWLYISWCKSQIAKHVIVDNLRFFLMKIANLMLVIVGDVSFLKEIANLMLVIVGGVSRFLMEIANCYRRYCFV